jgi:hypothetical protein
MVSGEELATGRLWDAADPFEKHVPFLDDLFRI